MLRRQAFTLIELLVVIAIIAVLVAILLPAIQKVREAANRAACMNKMKQLGLANHNYESERGLLAPAGKAYGLCVGGTPETDIINMNGLVLLLPFIEQTQLYQMANLESSFGSRVTSHVTSQGGALVGNPTTNGNEAVCRTVIPLFICPSDKSQQGAAARLINYTGIGQATNYDFVAPRGDYSVCNYWRSLPTHSRFIAGENSKTKFADVTDGSSNTFMFGETMANRRCNGPDNAWGFRSHAMTGIDPTIRVVNGYVAPSHSSWGGCYNPAVPEGTPNAALIQYGRLPEWGQAGSLHPGGCFFTMADGAVRFISENITTTTLGQLARMADGFSPLID